jgi:UDP:flavonoid glycosyltransferase YjiC (YdhE family)
VYEVWPLRDSGLKPYEAAVWAARRTLPVVRDFEPDIVVADIITTAASLAAQADGRPCATLVPHVLPTQMPGHPPYSVGARLPRTRAGARMWRALEPVTRGGLELGRQQLNGARARLGLPPLDYVHGGLSRDLTLVATFPQLEYSASAAVPWARVTGPLLWERPFPHTEPPPGDEPLVLVAPSTSQDPKQRMLLAALEGLADEPVRVLATTNRRPPPRPFRVPPNAKLVDWVSYAKAMPRCAAVVCHAGHGTVVRALASGAPVVACPAAGDMAENAARVAWAGVGVSLPRRLVTPRGVRLAVRRVLADDGVRRRARDLAAWAARNDGGTATALEVERFAARSVRAEPARVSPL